MTIEELINELVSSRVVISGGEPTIQNNLNDLIQALVNQKKRVHVETAGLKWHSNLSHTWLTLSPKTHLNKSQVVHEMIWANCDEIKIVIADGSEWEFYKQRILDVSMYNKHLFLQPAWCDREHAIPIILDIMQQVPKVRLSTQTHKYLHLP